MKKFSIILLLSLLSQSAYSMPCDTGYNCASKSGKYQVELQRCRYRNHLGLLSLKINNLEVSSAALNSSWDGDSSLAFEINLPSLPDGSVKIITAEMSPKLKKGIMKIKYAVVEPGPLSVIHSENIICKISE